MQLTESSMLERMYSRDKTADGRFLTGVLTTGIYCLPSCPARKPKADHVRFFADEAAALAAGLRACRRCRPDDFYRGFDPDLEDLAALVGRARAKPAAYADARSLAAGAGMGLTKLHGLLRRHYQLTPAALLSRARVAAACRLLAGGALPAVEVGLEVGFASLSTFHLHFRRQTGLTPGAYRRLGDGPEFVLALPEPYDAALMLRTLGRDPASPTERLNGSGLARALLLGERTALLRMEFGAGAVRCRVEADGPLGAAELRAAAAAAARLLGLQWDAEGFGQTLAADPLLTPLADGRAGARMPLTVDYFEGLAWSIIGQQINLPFAFALRQRLVRLCGQPAPGGLAAHPPAERVAALDYADLTALQFSRRKAEYLIDSARLVAEGALPLDALAAGPASGLERALLAVRGIGPWSANYLMMRGYGCADCVPVGDTGLTSGLQSFFGLERRPGPAETLALMERFAPHRSLATFYLWQFLGGSA